MSYYYFRAFNLDRLNHLRLIGDSGAFSAHSQGGEVTVDELAAWGTRWRHRLAWVAALDVIGDQKATRRNWQAAVSDHGLDAVPTIHYGTEPRALDWYADRGVDFVGLGGLVGLPLPKQMRWLVSVFKYQRANHPAMRFHGWGITSDRAMHLPFYSVDSSGWTGAMRFGTVKLRDPRGPRHDLRVKLDGRDPYRPEVAALLAREYGVNLKAVAKSTAATRPGVSRLGALSTSIHEQRIRARHGPITPPSWGLLEPPTMGMHLHLADSDREGPSRLNALAAERDDTPH